jgi:hypothetical protein
MTYRKLPFELELEALLQQGEAKMIETRGDAFLETASTTGFQLVTALLRDLERLAMHSLRTGTGRNPDRVLGRIEAIEEIRRSLVALLPDAQKANVDWFDSEEDDLPVNQSRDKQLG